LCSEWEVMCSVKKQNNVVEQDKVHPTANQLGVEAVVTIAQRFAPTVGAIG
jgi:hypothetical protein